MVYRAEYNRVAVYDYALKWWNDRNMNFPNFTDDCTGFVSQCLLAGGIPMHYTNNVESGWWFRRTHAYESWSYSWSVAHSLRWYLASRDALDFAHALDSAKELMIGDVIFYDWNGDGIWQHSAVVVGHDPAGEPLVAAHSVNSFNRPWAYESSQSWSVKTKYTFCHIFD